MNEMIYKILFYKILSFFPQSLQNNIAYLIKRNFGQLKSPIKTYGLLTAEDLIERIKQQKINPKNKIFFELGTGWVPYTSIQLSLLGAKKVYTQDIECLLKDEIVFELLSIILSNLKKGITSNYDRTKVEKIKKYTNLKNFSYRDLFKDLDIVYLSNSNPKDLDIKSESVDFYYSRSVLEHIPKNDLAFIISEGKRILNQDGIFISKIDLSDHFANNHNKLSQINFLKFNKIIWKFLSKNNFIYMNRLRISDYKKQFENSRMIMIAEDNTVNIEVLSNLKEGKFKVHEDFLNYRFEDLATTSSWLMYKKISS
tara:strand:+ start:1102 stop:2037 length:936 start_codon:yes stop_codon:yes gene_type:complete